MLRQLVLVGEGGRGRGDGVGLFLSSLAKAANLLEDWVAGVLSSTVSSSSELVSWRWRLVVDWR